MNKTIATIEKNQREQIVVALSEFEGQDGIFDKIDVRVFYNAGNDKMRPTRNGLSVPVQLLPELIEALEEAERQARAAGLIEDAAV